VDPFQKVNIDKHYIGKHDIYYTGTLKDNVITGYYGLAAG
jgi:hypothetical protein